MEVATEVQIEKEESKTSLLSEARNTADPMENVQRQFFCSYPIRQFNWMDVLDNLTVEQQDQLLNLTINNELNVNKPVQLSYQKRFLKTIIDKLEEQKLEVSETLYAAYLSMDDQPNELRAKYAFKHYKIGDKLDEIVSLKESINYISAGTTGLCTWEPAAAFAEWAVMNKSLFEGKNVIELGSGVGLLSSIIIRFCEPAQIVLTDGNEDVLALQRENLRINFGEFGLKWIHYKNTKIGSMLLPWESLDVDAIKKMIVPDLIIASDVIYDNALFDYLIGTIQQLVNLNPDNCYALIAFAERNPETFLEFVEMLKLKNLHYDNIEDIVTAPNLLCWDNSLFIKMIKIYP